MAASDWSEKTRIIITIAVGVVINAGLAFWLYSAYDQYAELEKQSNTKKKERAQLKNTVDVEKPELDKELARLKSSLAKKESLLPEKNEVEQLMISISDRAQEAGATLLSFARSSAPTVEGNYEKTVYRTHWQADFMSWCKLMNSMEEKFKRFIAFENLQLTPPGSGMVLMGAKHEINVDVVVYRYVRSN
jgi:Tfp pilus assembly protein PilO